MNECANECIVCHPSHIQTTLTCMLPELPLHTHTDALSHRYIDSQVHWPSAAVAIDLSDNVHLSVELQSGAVSVDTSDVDLNTDNDSTVAVAVTKLQTESSTTWPSSLQVLTLDNTGTTK